MSRTTWLDRAGAPGFEGATLHADLDGDGAIGTSVTWTGRARDGIRAPAGFEGLLWFQ